MSALEKYGTWSAVILSVAVLSFAAASPTKDIPSKDPKRVVSTKETVPSAGINTSTNQYLAHQKRLLKQSEQRITSLEKDLTKLEQILKKRAAKRKARRATKQR